MQEAVFYEAGCSETVLVCSNRKAAASRLCAFEESFLTNCHTACRNIQWCHFQLE